MPQNFSYKGVPNLEDTESVVITRRTPNAIDPTKDDVSTIYSGPADVQTIDGIMFYNPSGAVPEYDAICIIDPNAAGALPPVLQNDIVTVTGGNNDIYFVTSINFWTHAPNHLRIKMKKGGMSYGMAPR